MQTYLRGAIIAYSIAIAATTSVAAENFDLQSRIDPVVRPVIEDEIAVGVVIGILRDGQTQILAYGETKKGSGVAPDGETIYEIGSVSKVFTGVLLADVVRSGLVDLDDPLQKFVPKGVQVPVFDGHPITLENLATHTSGLPRMPDNFHPADPTNPYADYSIEQMYAFLEGFKPIRSPGTHEYSNFGMGLLGQILARRQETSYEQLLTDRITSPLGMEDTRITLNKEQQRRLAPPYNAALEPDKNWDIPTLAGAGAIRSTCNDLLTFLEAFMEEDEIPLGKSLRESLVIRHKEKNGAMIGLGWLANQSDVRWHNGMTGGYHVFIAIVPERKIGVAVLSNTATMQITELGQRVFRIACGETVEPLPRRTVIHVDSEVLERYAGYYAITPEFGLTVKVNDGKLFVQATGQPAAQDFPKSKTEFFYKVVNAQITFVTDKEGAVNQLILHQRGHDIKGHRQPTP